MRFIFSRSSTSRHGHHWGEQGQARRVFAYNPSNRGSTSDAQPRSSAYSSACRTASDHPEDFSDSSQTDCGAASPNGHAF